MDPPTRLPQGLKKAGETCQQTMIHRDLWLHICQARHGQQPSRSAREERGSRGLVTGSPEIECSQKTSLPNINPSNRLKYAQSGCFSLWESKVLSGGEPSAGTCGVPAGRDGTFGLKSL